MSEVTTACQGPAKGGCQVELVTTSPQTSHLTRFPENQTSDESRIHVCFGGKCVRAAEQKNTAAFVGTYLYCRHHCVRVVQRVLDVPQLFSPSSLHGCRAEPRHKDASTKRRGPVNTWDQKKTSKARNRGIGNNVHQRALEIGNHTAAREQRKRAT